MLSYHFVTVPLPPRWGVFAERWGAEVLVLTAAGAFTSAEDEAYEINAALHDLKERKHDQGDPAGSL